MLQLPSGSVNYINIIGIDPGSTTLGVALVKVNLDDLKISSSNAWTLNAAKLSNDKSWVAETYGDRFNRIHTLEEQLLRVFNFYHPHLIISEAPFINQKFPAAGIALTEVMCGIRSAVFKYDIWKQLHIVAPSSAKQIVDASTPGGGKTLMKEKLLALHELNYNGTVPMVSLDEHSIDSLAVAYYGYRTLIRGN